MGRTDFCRHERCPCSSGRSLRLEIGAVRAVALVCPTGCLQMSWYACKLLHLVRKETRNYLRLENPEDRSFHLQTSPLL